MNERWIFFDMDGTIASLYTVENWLDKLQAGDPSPYLQAAPMLNMNTLARKLNELQRRGYKLGIISWLSKNSTAEYDELVKKSKLRWLKKHLSSVHWNAINIVPYGTDKWQTCGKGILFDDEEKNRITWQAKSFHPVEIMKVLKELN